MIEERVWRGLIKVTSQDWFKALVARGRPATAWLYRVTTTGSVLYGRLRLTSNGSCAGTVNGVRVAFSC